MAQKVQVLLVDDLEGGEAEETVSFGVDGSVYEIDLNSSNATTLREALAPFVEAGRKSSTRQTKGAAQGARKSSSRQRSADIRAWAKATGKPVNDRGRIPESIVAEYEAAKQ